MQKENLLLKSSDKNNLSSPNTYPSSPRSVSMRGIGAAHTLYPALQTCGMTERMCRVARMANHGFTLIELLVVVLIIGILAAVAVPQYQKAVWKSRSAQLQTLLASVAQAGEVYHLNNGTWPVSFDDLDIDVGGTPLGQGQTTCEDSLYSPATRRFDNYEISLYNGGIDHRYLVSAHFITGKYKCTGFVHYFDTNKEDASLNQQTFCMEGHYNRSCGTNCDNGAFCKKLMKKKSKYYYQLMNLYE